MKKLTVAIFLVVLMSIASGVFVFQQVSASLKQEANVAEDEVLHLKSGTALYSLFSYLDSRGVYDNSVWLKLAVKLNPALLNIKAGTYEISPQMSLAVLLDKLKKGEEKQFLVTLVEGLTAKDWLSLLNSMTFLTSPLSDTDIEQWVLTEQLSGGSIEGWLLADSYAVTYGTPVIEVVERAYQSMQLMLNDLWQNRYPDLPYQSAYEALIMASIIEKETGVATEREHIAGVFVNRLNANMRLQTDPTVIYGIGESFDGNLTRKHLRTHTPYNTYIIKGLPPTPIAMASRASLIAAFNPMITDDYYFVAKGDGTHYFSSTLEQHNRAVRQYQLGIKE